jgi:hypothetical protein
MAQCRYASGEPTNLTMALCAKLSTDDGDTWGALAKNITGAPDHSADYDPSQVNSGQDPAAVWDAVREQIVLFFDTRKANVSNPTAPAHNKAWVSIYVTKPY